MSHLDELRRTLLALPAQHAFNFDQRAKDKLREAIFTAVSCQGKYLGLFFPELAAHTPSQAELVAFLDTEVNWLFKQYDEYVARSSKDHVRRDIKQAYHVGLPCARIFRRGEPIYKCLSCGFDELCAMCLYCFLPHQHEGHNVHVMICQRENGGVCDCGDPEAWNIKFECKYSPVSGWPNPSAHTPAPPELALTFEDALAVLIDYIIDVMSQSDQQLFPQEDTKEYPEIYAANCSLDPTKYGYPDNLDADTIGEKYSLIAYNDQVRHFRDAVQRIHLASRKVQEFAIMVAEQISTSGRATVIRSRDLHLLSERQSVLNLTGLSSCIRNTRDEFREGMCYEIVLWVSAIVERDFFKRDDNIKSALCRVFCSKWQSGLRSAVSTAAPEYCKGRLDRHFRIPNLNCISPSSSKSHWAFTPSLWDTNPTLSKDCDFNQDLSIYAENSWKGSRFQYLVFFDIRFWKSLRVQLHDLYLTSLITNLKFKKIFAAQYVDIYPVVADMFLSVDSEPELNIMSKLSSQLYTCPSNSTSIINHGDVSRIFASIYCFLRDDHIDYSPAGTVETHNISLLSLKNRRWGQIFFDIGYILSRGRDPELILTNTIIPMACDILALFQGKPTMRREVETHVEYENSEYTAFFHAILVIYQFAEYISQSVTHLEGEQRQMISQSAIHYVVNFLLRLELVTTDNASECNEVDYGLSVSDEFEPNFSFLHPLHSFLSWLIEFSNFSLIDNLRDIFSETLKSFELANPSFTNQLTESAIFKYPLQTIVLSSQIKAGLWVRNGFSIRSQLQLYEGASLRKQGFLRDLFLVQIFCVISSPDTIVSTILEKWKLNEQWDVESQEHAIYGQPIIVFMVEECMNFFIHLYSDHLFLRHLTTEATTVQEIKNEIIHNLCFAPMTYSKLCAQLPEHISTEKKFDQVLESLTIFRKPASSKDTGTFVLKDQYMDEVNPFYFNYTTNKKDDAIKLVKERAHKLTSKCMQEITITPKLAQPEKLGIYKNLGNFSLSHHFVEFLGKSIELVKNEGLSKSESLFESILHLLRLCSKESLTDINTYGTFAEKVFRDCDGTKTSIVKQLYDLLLVDEFKNHHVTIRSIFCELGHSQPNLLEMLDDHIPGFDPSCLNFVTGDASGEDELERKKRLAKQRQAKLMAKFKKQQSLFSKAHNVMNDCSDTEMEDSDDSGWKFPEAHCILCQDKAESAGPFGIISYVSKSSSFRQVPFEDEYWILKAYSDNVNLNQSTDDTVIPQHHSKAWEAFMSLIRDKNVMGPGFDDQQYIQSKLVSLTCGHGMHFNCYMQFLSSNRSRMSQITRNAPENAEHREFLCPLCKAINNMFIPILWSANDRSMKLLLYPELSPSNTFDVFKPKAAHEADFVEEFSKRNTRDLQDLQLTTANANSMIGGTDCENASESHQHFKVLLSNMFQVLSLITFPHIFKSESPQLLINSIRSTEISLRGSTSVSNLVAFQVSNNVLINLRALNEFRLTCLLMKSLNHDASLCKLLVTQVMMLSNIQKLSHDHFNHTILYGDFFEILVQTIPMRLMLISFHTVLHTCFVGHILQTAHILSLNLSKEDFFVDKQYTLADIPYLELITEEEAIRALELFNTFESFKNSSVITGTSIPKQTLAMALYSMLIKSVTPFLRQATIYAFIFCADSEGLLVPDSDDIIHECDLLCNFLKIPTIGSILEALSSSSSGWERQRLNNFVARSRKKFAPNDDKLMRKTIDYPGIVRLVELPTRLDQYFTSYHYLPSFNQPHLSIDNPAICLICAEVLDAQKNALVSSQGQCSVHFRKECANNVGIFLLPKERCVLLLHRNGGTFYDAPYLDQHGELAAENKKGKPMFLLPSKLNDLTSLWLQHHIPNVIVRKLDSVIDAGGWDTL